MIGVSQETFLGLSPTRSSKWAANQGVQSHTFFFLTIKTEKHTLLNLRKDLDWLVPSTEIRIHSLPSQDNTWVLLESEED